MRTVNKLAETGRQAVILLAYGQEKYWKTTRLQDWPEKYQVQTRQKVERSLSNHVHPFSAIAVNCPLRGSTKYPQAQSNTSPSHMLFVLYSLLSVFSPLIAVQSMSRVRVWFGALSLIGPCLFSRTQNAQTPPTHVFPSIQHHPTQKMKGKQTKFTSKTYQNRHRKNTLFLFFTLTHAEVWHEDKNRK